MTCWNNEFDGVTSWSLSCNGQHYQTLLLGLADWYTFEGNYLHDVFGCAPHVGTDYDASNVPRYTFIHSTTTTRMLVVMHTIFAQTLNTWVFIGGDYFDNVDTPMTSDSQTSGGQIWSTATAASTGHSVSDLGYICEQNRPSGSGTWSDLEDSAVLSAFESYKSSLTGHTGVSSDVTANAGIKTVSFIWMEMYTLAYTCMCALAHDLGLGSVQMQGNLNPPSKNSTSVTLNGLSEMIK